MGEVYRAEDTKLGRVVALKVLPADTAADPTRLVRLQQEARALAALDHPNIVTLLSVEEDDGVHFLTMTLVEGNTLTKLIPVCGMPLDAFFDIAIPLAEALTAAHAKGLIHRDLKPPNVMINDAGIVKVLDFGLAKLTDARRGDETATMGITQEGAVVGTPSYMSPEQLENDAVDHRADIFSLGVVLHEMASGRKPFSGKSTPALMSSILKDTPLSVTELRDELPEHLGHVVSRCLAKNPDQRFQTARDVANELVQLRDEVRSTSITRSRVAATPQPEACAERSVAVLPFVNRSPNPDDEYFSDGLSEELISALSKLEGLKVTARSSAFQFRGQDVDVREVGRKLGVETVLEGSVRVAGNRLRITAQLIDCSNGYQLWSERYDGEMKDIFDTQDEIAQAITGALRVELGSGSDVRLVKRGTDDADAYHLYLRGRRSYLGALGESGIVPALDCFTRALERDPSFALAHASVAECQLVRSIFGTVPGSKGLPLARQAAERALALDDGLPEAHMAMGACYTNYDHDWERAARSRAGAADCLDPLLLRLLPVGRPPSRRGDRVDAPGMRTRPAIRLHERPPSVIALFRGQPRRGRAGSRALRRVVSGVLVRTLRPRLERLDATRRRGDALAVPASDRPVGSGAHRGLCHCCALHVRARRGGPGGARESRAPASGAPGRLRLHPHRGRQHRRGHPLDRASP
jgi:serine/threonine protein kinase